MQLIGTTSTRLGVCLLGLMVVGCTPRNATVATRVEIPTASPVPDQFDLTNLGLALNRIVSGEKLRPRALLKARPLLDSFLAQVAEIGPTTEPSLFTSSDARLAYALNCRIACLLRSLVELSTPTTVPDKASAGFDRRFAFRVDGAWQTAGDLAATVRREKGDDWRVILALSTVRGDGPAIPARPWLPDLLDAQLDRAVRDALMSPRVALLDYGEVKQILFWQDFWAIRRTLLSDYERRTVTTDARLLNVLLEWAETSFDRVTLNSAVGYVERPMPVDRTIPWTGLMVAE